MLVFHLPGGGGCSASGDWPGSEYDSSDDESNILEKDLEVSSSDEDELEKVKMSMVKLYV